MTLVLMKNPVSTRDRNSSDCVSWLGSVSNTVSKRKDTSCCKCNSAKLVSLFPTLTPWPQSPNWLPSLGQRASLYPFSSALPTPVICSFGSAVTTFMKGVSCASAWSVSSEKGRTTVRTWCRCLRRCVPPANHWRGAQHYAMLHPSLPWLIALIVILPKDGLLPWRMCLLSNLGFWFFLLVYYLPRHIGLLLPFHLQKCLFSR